MTSDFKIVEQPKPTMAMHPKKFALWLFIVSISMIFISLTSAYIVRQAEGDWRFFDLPVEMYYTTAIILVSSVTMHWAYLAARKDELGQVKLALTLTTILGVAFLVGQFMVYDVLVGMNVNLTGGNPSESFLYIISGLHGAHIISGIIFLLIVLTATFKFKVHSKNLNQIQMCTTYWHFLDVLWVYLFLFLLFYR